MKTYGQFSKEYLEEKTSTVDVEETLLQAIDEGFTPEQIKNLQQEFGKIKRVDPTSPAMQKVTKLVTGMSDADLDVIIQAKIPFVSGIAISERVRRKFQ